MSLATAASLQPGTLGLRVPPIIGSRLSFRRGLKVCSLNHKASKDRREHYEKQPFSCSRTGSGFKLIPPADQSAFVALDLANQRFVRWKKYAEPEGTGH